MKRFFFVLLMLGLQWILVAQVIKLIEKVYGN
jgi:hypothetical protein